MPLEVAGVVARLGFRVDDDGANRFERKVRDLRGDAKRDVVVPLRGDLQAKDLDLYDKKLREIRDKVRRREDFKAHLGADYDPRAFTAYERDSRRIAKQTDDNVRSAGRLRTAFGNIWVGGGAAFAAAGGGYAIYAGLRSIVTASGEAEVSAAKLKTQVEALGGTYSAHAKQIDDVIQKTSLLAGIDDEDLADAFTNIARTSGSVKDGLEGIGLAADIARARHMDVAKAGDLVGKVFAGNFTALKRYGIVLKDNATTEQAIAAIQEKFAGQARAYGRTQQGSIERLQVAWENLQETLGKNLAPTIARTADRLAKFVTGMTNGTGKGGEFADKLKEIWGRLVAVYKALDTANRALENFYARVGRGAKRTADDILGLASTILGTFADIASAGAKLKIPGMKGISDDLRRMQHDLDKTREGLRKTGDEANKIDMRKVRGETRQTSRAFADMAKDGGGSVRDIASVVRRRSNDIRKDLGGNSREGKEALRNNFREAMDAVRRQMDRGEITTRDGMRAIRGYLRDELRVYGMSIAQGQKLGASNPFSAASGRANAGNAGPNSPNALGRAGGGWIGAAGMVGQDSVPAMLAPGEAVLNRHQQAVIEGMLGGGFLDRLFARVQTPHYMARGGIVPVPGFPGEEAASSVVSKIVQIARQFGLTLTDAFDRDRSAGHKSAGHNVTGTAADFAGSDRSMDAAVRSLVRAGYLVGYDGRFGSQAWPGHGPSSVAGGNAHLHVELGGKGGNIAGALARIAGVRVRGGGEVGRVVQGALNMARDGAQAFLGNAASSMLAVPVGGGGTGGGNAGNRRLGRAMLSQFGFGGGQFGPLDRLWTGESGWNERARNASSGAYGIPQALPGSKMASAGGDWQSNPATQIKWGLGYIKERYGSPARAYAAWQGRSPHWYSGGGRVQGFAKGGRPKVIGSHPQATTRDTGEVQGFRIKSAQRTLTHRIGEYEDWMSAVERTRSRYSIAERLYNRVDAGSLVNEDTGEVNIAAVQEKASHIWDMIVMAGQIVQYLENARRVARRVLSSYQTVVKRLRGSLKWAAKKDRSGIHDEIRTAVEGRDEYAGIVGDLGFDIKNARLDWEDLGKERDELLATKGTPPDTAADAATDTTTADTGATPDQEALTAQANARASALAADLSATRANFAAFTGTGDIGSARGSSAFGSTLVDAVGGVGGLGAAGIPGGFVAGGNTVIVNSYAMVPGSAEENLRISDAVVTALGTRPVSPVTQATVGG